MTTDIERYTPNGVALFPGATADEILTVAADVATKFGDVVKRQRMFRRIGQSDHIQIEAWQTIGALTGVVAPEGEVQQLAWPPIESLGQEPPLPGREPRNRDSDEWHTWKRADKIRSAWERHDDMLRARAMGKAYGFKCEFRATKTGAPVGWGEGSVDRNEANWVNKDDHELRSMAQTRAQSRALGAPLKFVVKLAGYETTPAEELDGHASAPAAADPAQTERIAALERQLAAAQQAPPGAGRTYEDREGPRTWDDEANDEQMNQAAGFVRVLAAPAEVNGEQFILAMGEHFNGVPVTCVTMLRGLARFIGDTRTASGEAPPENAPPAQGSGYQGVSPEDVYPPGKHPGD